MEDFIMRTDKVIGINGLGRMGKLILWNLIAKGQKRVVVNIGRKVGESKKDFLNYILKDSTYGNLFENLNGRLNHNNDFNFNFEVTELKINRTLITFLQINQGRNPGDIPWEDYEVSLVIDATGKFNYPGRGVDHPGGSIRGHFGSPSVEKVFITSPFKEGIPDDSVMIVHGINHQDYKPAEHDVISNASCSTTCLAHMINPWVKALDPRSIKAVSVDIPHAKTSKQPSLDRLPLTGKSDPCTWRSSNENIFISSTGAAKALPVVIPKLKNVSFSASSIRVPSDTVSLAIATLLFEDDLSGISIAEVYRKYGAEELLWSEGDNASRDFLGSNQATIIDGKNCQIMVCGNKLSVVKLYGWFDNEWGYVSMFMRNLKMILETI
jgi:glyceraldehyde 3-phosphate dehydrogenase